MHKFPKHAFDLYPSQIGHLGVLRPSALQLPECHFKCVGATRERLVPRRKDEETMGKVLLDTKNVEVKA